MKTLFLGFISLAIFSSLYFTSCKSCNNNRVPEIKTCGPNEALIDGYCQDTLNFYFEPTHHWPIAKFDLPYLYVTYSTLPDFDSIFYCAIRGNSPSWPNNPEQLGIMAVACKHAGTQYTGPNQNFQTTYLDPVKGDSLFTYFETWDLVTYVRFEGRFTKDRKYLRGTVEYFRSPYYTGSGYVYPTGKHKIEFMKYQR